jgi:hypothetical protein
MILHAKRRIIILLLLAITSSLIHKKSRKSALLSRLKGVISVTELYQIHSHIAGDNFMSTESKNNQECHEEDSADKTIIRSKSTGLDESPSGMDIDRVNGWITGNVWGLKWTRQL